MVKRIGPSFASEIAAAGLNGQPFSWGADGNIQYAERMTQADRARVESVYAAHDPNTPAPLSKYEQEMAALMAHLDEIEQRGTPDSRELARLLKPVLSVLGTRR